MTAAGGVTLEFNEANGNEVDITGGTYTGSGTLLKTGSGTLGPGNGYYPTSTVDLSPGGLIDVEQGELNASKTNQGNWLSNQGSLKIAGGATFNMEEQNIQVDAITGAGTLIASYWGSSKYTPHDHPRRRQRQRHILRDSCRRGVLRQLSHPPHQERNRRRIFHGCVQLCGFHHRQRRHALGGRYAGQWHLHHRRRRVRSRSTSGSIFILIMALSRSPAPEPSRKPARASFSSAVIITLRLTRWTSDRAV